MKEHRLYDSIYMRFKYRQALSIMINYLGEGE